MKNGKIRNKIELIDEKAKEKIKITIIYYLIQRLSGF